MTIQVFGVNGMVRRYVPLMICLLALVNMASLSYSGTAAERRTPEKSVESGGSAPIKRTVILQRVYLDGEMSEEQIEETILSMDDFWRKYEKWLLVDQDDQQLVFQTYVDDISPLLKGNGYFGIKSDGTISIFNGKPAKDQIIQSFFQIDIKKLESSKQLELKQGVKISNKKRYLDLLEAYKPYSITTGKSIQ